jgi:hypothetical protein
LDYSLAYVKPSLRFFSFFFCFMDLTAQTPTMVLASVGLALLGQ